MVETSGEPCWTTSSVYQKYANKDAFWDVATIFLLLWEWTEKHRVASSANETNFRSCYPKSEKNVKNKGARTLPWGTPKTTGRTSEQASFTITHCLCNAPGEGGVLFFIPLPTTQCVEVKVSGFNNTKNKWYWATPSVYLDYFLFIYCLFKDY